MGSEREKRLWANKKNGRWEMDGQKRRITPFSPFSISPEQITRID